MIEDERTGREGPETGDAQTGDNAPEESAPQADAPAEASAPQEDAPQEDAPQADAPQEEKTAEESAPDATPAEDQADAPAEPSVAPESPPRARREDTRPAEAAEVVPGADLEPDLVLDEPAAPEDRYAQEGVAYAESVTEAEEGVKSPTAAKESEDAPVPRSPMELAADARYQATGKRKTSVARVILRPGNGSYTVNGRSLEEFFPRPTLQKVARQPLSTAGYDARMDVVAKLHGGGVSAQAGALRHGVARALVEADPNLRGDLKRRGFLTRDPRVKERKKAGLKKARKRPQFSKR